MYIYSYSVTLLYIPRLMSENFYFSKDCLSRDKRRKGEIEERTSEILFIEVGIFERKFRSLERKTGEEEGKVFARQTPWRVLMPRICETQEENGNGRERERERETVFEQRKRRVRKRCPAPPSRHEQLHA